MKKGFSLWRWIGLLALLSGCAVTPTPLPVTPQPITPVAMLPTAAVPPGTPLPEGIPSPASEFSGYRPLSASSENPEIADSYIDLDSGSARESNGADLHFIISDGPGHPYLLQPVNNATAVAYSRTGSPDYLACQQAPKSTEPVSQIYEGIYLCLQTSSGAIVRAHIDRFDTQTNNLQLSFTAWVITSTVQN
jgi:hypothetical protein